MVGTGGDARRGVCWADEDGDGPVNTNFGNLNVVLVTTLFSDLAPYLFKGGGYARFTQLDLSTYMGIINLFLIHHDKCS